MKKRSQVTIFIIIGLVLVIGLVVFYSMMKSSKRADILKETKQAMNLNVEAEILKSIVDDCIVTEYKKARDIYGIADTSSIGLSLQTNLPMCIVSVKNPVGSGNFFEARGLKIEPDDSKLKVEINPFVSGQPVVVKVTYPITITELNPGSDRANKMQVNEFVYSYPTTTDGALSAVGGRVSEPLRVVSGDGDLTLIIKKDTKIRNFEGDIIADLDKFKITVEIDREASGTPLSDLYGRDLRTLGKTVYRIKAEPLTGGSLPGGGLYFEPKVEIRKDFTDTGNINMMDSQKSYSFWIKLGDDIPDFLAPGGSLSSMTANLVGSGSEMPCATYGDTQNKQIVGYCPFFGEEIHFYDVNCMDIIYSTLPQCPVNTKIDSTNGPCMCGEDYISENEQGIMCLDIARRMNICERDSHEPEVLPCKCDRFIIYCQDNKLVPRKSQPTFAELRDAATSSATLLPGLLPRLVTIPPPSTEEAMQILVEEMASAGTIPPSISELFFEDNPYYDPLVCSPKRYS